MATYSWTGQQGADWFDPANWISTAGSAGVPVSGDVAFVYSGPAPVIPGGTLVAGVSLLVGAASGTVPVGLTLDGAAIGAGTTITNNVASGLALITAIGDVTLAGTLEASTAQLLLELAGGATMTNSGTLGASFGTLAVTGASGATLVNAGVLGALQQYGGLAVIVAATLDNSGTVLETALLSPGVTAAVTLDGPVSGTGTIIVGSAGAIAVDGAVAAGQHVDFATDVGTLVIGDLAGFAAAIGTVTGHDIIDVTGVTITATSYGAATHMLTLLDAGRAVGTLAVASGGSLTATGDGRGGSILTTELAGTPAQIANYIVNGTTGSSGGAHWALPASGPVQLTYAFDPTANLTSAETASLTAALRLWSDIADVTFTPTTDYAGADIDFTTNTQGYAETFSDTEGDLLTQATVDIDPAVFDGLHGPGLADTTGGGGYGFMTALHEEGHALGLHHPGPYNGHVDIGTQQLFYTDSRQYSLMSYIDAAYTGADTSVGNTTVSPQTPMLADIDAIQSVYGADPSVLTGGDTFGFDSDFGPNSAHPVESYDFTQNPAPVLALYDGGTDNTLNLSGFSAGGTVNLNAGSFSSVDGLTDDIAIAYDTQIDGAVGGSGNELFVVNGDADTIVGGGGIDTAGFAGLRADYALASGPGGDLLVRGIAGGFTATDTLRGISTLAFADETQAPCYCRGTAIATAAGEQPVETLRIGDLVRTASGALRPVHWIGRRGYGRDVLACRPDLLPVMFRAGALGAGVPHRDLIVSPRHAMFLDDVLIPAELLVNGITVRRAAAMDVAYFHIELDSHDILLAEGAAAESFADCDSRALFDNAASSVASSVASTLASSVACHPGDTRPTWRLCARLVEDGPVLADVRRRLAARAGLLADHVADAPVAGPLEGCVDVFDHQTLAGWAFDAAQPHTAVRLAICIDGEVVASVVANQNRDDLRAHGRGEGRCGFRWVMPTALSPTVVHTVELLRADGASLRRRLCADPPAPGMLEGCLDTRAPTLLEGWALDRSWPETPVRLEIVASGHVVGQAIADQFRPDLADAGKARGFCRFVFPIDPPCDPARFAVRRATDHAIVC